MSTKMRGFLAGFTLFAVVAVALGVPPVLQVGAYTSDATAPRFVYLPADQRMQMTGLWDPNALPDTYIQLRWRSGLPLRWYISVNEPNDPNFEQHIKDAAAAWESKVSALQWADVPEPSAATADIVFKLKATCASIFGSGSYSVNVETESKDLLRVANYVTDAEICIKSSITNYWDRREALLHEMGHAYGLHDRFLQDYTYYPTQSPIPVGCNPYEVSVMDALDCDNLEVPSHTIDAYRVWGYWGHGWAGTPSPGADVAKVFPADFPQLSNPATGVLRGTFGDYSWGQTSFWVQAEQLVGPNWQYLSGRYVDAGVGSMGIMTGFPEVTMRVFQEDFDVRALGGTSGNRYRECIRSHNYGYGWSSIDSCAASIPISW